MQRNVNLIESDRSRQEFSNEYLVAKFGFDTTENADFASSLLSLSLSLRFASKNESSKVCQRLVRWLDRLR